MDASLYWPRAKYLLPLATYLWLTAVGSVLHPASEIRTKTQGKRVNFTLRSAVSHEKLSPPCGARTHACRVHTRVNAGLRDWRTIGAAYYLGQSNISALKCSCIRNQVTLRTRAC